MIRYYHLSVRGFEYISEEIRQSGSSSLNTAIMFSFTVASSDGPRPSGKTPRPFSCVSMAKGAHVTGAATPYISCKYVGKQSYMCVQQRQGRGSRAQQDYGRY
ncbi:hypothetical protein AOLI_G00084540 [Acnodon oligacanthus]